MWFQLCRYLVEGFSLFIQQSMVRDFLVTLKLTVVRYPYQSHYHYQYDLSTIYPSGYFFFFFMEIVVQHTYIKNVPVQKQCEYSMHCSINSIIK